MNIRVHDELGTGARLEQSLVLPHFNVAPADSGVLTPAAGSQTAKPGTAALALASRWPDGLHASAVTRERDVRNVMLASAEALLHAQEQRSLWQERWPRTQDRRP